MEPVIELMPDDTKLICPFRLVTVTFKQEDDSVVQQLYYPECYYRKCPYYDMKENSCYKTYVE